MKVFVKNFKPNLCDTLWISIEFKYIQLLIQAVSILIDFVLYYIYTKGSFQLSNMAIIKNQYRFRININAHLKVVTSNTESDLNSVVSNIREYKSVNN